MAANMRFGPAIMEQARTLAAITERPGMLARSYLTPQHRQAGELIAGWMRAAGMEAGFDALGNVVGRYAGSKPGAPTILTGSHMDTVVDAGAYDGMFGVLAPIACVAELARQGKRLAFPIEVIAFGDEEGVRFGTSMMGSKALAGKLDAAVLDNRDAGGVTVREALRAFGGDPDALAGLRRAPEKIRVFVETHIEQGPVLLNEGLAVGVVSAIAGSTRARVAVTGEEGHAGTVPMAVRRDALAAAAEMALEVERCARAAGGDVVGTVGKFAVAAGGAINVIPGRVEFSVDTRSGTDAIRQRVAGEIEAGVRRIAEARKVGVEWAPLQEMLAATCDSRERESMADAIRAQGLAVRHLPSGAGHDTMQFHGVAPIAMLFVRCGNGGISHSPRETLAVEDAEVAAAVLLRYLESLE